MKPLAWMVGVSLTSWALVAIGSAGRSDPEVLVGMVGPLLCALASWVVYERTHRSTPKRLTNVMIAALAAKMVFFAAYVFVMLRVLWLEPVVFVVSFTSYFIGLHAMEAAFLRRLLSVDLQSPGVRT